MLNEIQNNETCTKPLNGIEVISAGLNTQLQDAGRKGYGFAGVGQSGFLDARAAFIANRLCGNPTVLPLLEIPWGGFKCVFQVNTLIAVCGAQVTLTINNQHVECWRSHRVKCGDELSISAPVDGIWVYLAVRGGFVAKPVLGSVATNKREKMGGFHRDGRGVSNGDVLSCRETKHEQCLALTQKQSLAMSRISTRFNRDSELILRLIPGAQFKLLSRIQKRAVFTSQFSLSKDYSRMGYKLTGTNRVLHNLPKITPDAIGYGAVQITPAGHPIVLLNDRQTLGGYCKIGSVISPDCHGLVQCRPGTKFRFQLIRPINAHRLINHYWAELSGLPLTII